MKKIVLAAVVFLASALCFAGCNSVNHNNTSSMSIYQNKDNLDNCTHISEFHVIPGGLIRYVGNERFEQEFNSVYKDTEGYNIVNFIKVFDISRQEFETIVANYGIQLKENTPYDLDVLYSNDEKKINEYFKNNSSSNSSAYTSTYSTYSSVYSSY